MISATPQQEALARLLQEYTRQDVTVQDLQQVAAGASGRCIMRAPGLAAAQGVIGIAWTPARADNASFVPAAHGLAQAGVPVPAVLAEVDSGDGCGACLVEDLGDADLLSLKKRPWSERREAYRLALQSVTKLHRLTPDWLLQPPFDAALYRWEQSYFAGHLLGRHLGLDAAAFMAQPALQEMADWLASLPRVPVHRDFQSQNILLKGGRAWLIDFQGMRMGRAEYDLASLLCDPYMTLTPAEQNELLQEYETCTGRPLDMEIYCACALQRVMQALGAFANIGYNQHRDWYINLIPAGLEALRRIAAQCPAGSIPQRVASCLPKNVRP